MPSAVFDLPNSLHHGELLDRRVWRTDEQHGQFGARLLQRQSQWL